MNFLLHAGHPFGSLNELLSLLCFVNCEPYKLQLFFETNIEQPYEGCTSAGIAALRWVIFGHQLVA